MSKAIQFYSKKLPKSLKEPKKCSDLELMKICDAYTDYMDALCDEDGHVSAYERVAAKMSDWFEELEERKK